MRSHDILDLGSVAPGQAYQPDGNPMEKVPIQHLGGYFQWGTYFCPSRVQLDTVFKYCCVPYG